MGAHHSGFCDWCDDPLTLWKLQLSFKLVAEGEWDCFGCVDAEWLGIHHQCYVEFLTIHGFNLSVEDRWEFTSDVERARENWLVDGGGGKAQWGS